MDLISFSHSLRDWDTVGNTDIRKSCGTSLGHMGLVSSLSLYTISVPIMPKSRSILRKQGVSSDSRYTMVNLVQGMAVVLGKLSFLFLSCYFLFLVISRLKIACDLCCFFCLKKLVRITVITFLLLNVKL